MQDSSRDERLRGSLDKVEALLERSEIAGERAAAANDRLLRKLAESCGGVPLQERRFALRDCGSLMLFVSLARALGVAPHRGPGLRRHTVLVKATCSLVNDILWPKFLASQARVEEGTARPPGRTARRVTILAQPPHRAGHGLSRSRPTRDAPVVSRAGRLEASMHRSISRNQQDQNVEA